MEWYIVALVLLLLLSTVLNIYILVCILNRHGCTILFQRRTPNPDLTKYQQEEKNNQKSVLEKLFRSSSQIEQALKPVEDVETFEFSVNLHDTNNDKKKEEDDNKKKDDEFIIIEEATINAIRKNPLTQAERDRRLKYREEIRKKYNL